MSSPTTVAEVTLPLHLFGPMQAWGTAGAMDFRMTGDFPTKSGLVGMMAAALGRPHGADNADLAALGFAVRLDRKGTKSLDFQTVRKANPTASQKAHTSSMLFVPFSDDGSSITYREYLIWYGFTAFIAGDATLLAEVRDALLSPAWDMALGRRNCQPAVPVSDGTLLNMDMDEALASHWPSYTDDNIEHRVWRDARPGEAWLLVADEPLGDRRFGTRTVTVTTAERSE